MLQGPSPDSKEFKMLLNPSKLKHVKQGMDKLWKKVEHAAEDVGLEVSRAKDEVRTQDIVFLDTPDAALKNQGYILRYRDVHGGSKDDNLTLKFRGQDPSQVVAADVDAAPGVKSKPKFELDQTFQDQESFVYSKSNKVKVPHLPEPTLENLAGVFPVLDGLGLEGSTKLSKLHAGGIVEERHLLGNVHLGQHETAPAYLTLWYDEEHGKTPAVAEFSFAHPAHADGTDAASEELMRNLHDRAPKWLSHGSTKTNFAYSE